MKSSSACAALVLLSMPAIVYGAGTSAPRKAAPAIVPYLCQDGGVANVVYENGGDYRHARALISYDARTLEMSAAPALYGVRYRTAVAGEPALAWSLRGEEARLTESPDADGYTRPERELARCVRLRRLDMTGAQENGAAHGDSH
ncbi:MliC family protein [Sphingosinicella sp. CPCC 101087]|uniref:MliC family protein n=1 Tax=Sphingosinicella sp. CPCC 101087 TaxID=2497754 RepID=UPI00101D0648|nr:MliC family protein [Sphingosinicella sp. CPCC 101087]